MPCTPESNFLRNMADKKPEFNLDESEMFWDELFASNYNDPLTNAFADSEKEYLKIVNRVVDISEKQLNAQNKSKEKLRNSFSKFFKWLISLQLGFLALLLVGKALIPNFALSDQIIIVFITSVFVETLAGVIYMIIYAFNCDQEVKTTEILNGVIRYFQKTKL